MRHSLKTGFSFGLVSGVITTLGLMAGLYSGTDSRSVVLGAVLMIALADSLSDALGIHVSEESENKHSHRSVWEATFSTFIFKCLVTLTFAVPVVFFSLKTALLISIIWGGLLISVFSLHLGSVSKSGKSRVLIEHLLIGAFVVAGTYSIGLWISGIFK